MRRNIRRPRFNALATLLTILISAPVAAMAQQTVIDFEGWPDHTIIHDQYLLNEGVRISVDNFANAVDGPYIIEAEPVIPELPDYSDFLCTNIIFAGATFCRNDVEVRFVAPGDPTNRVLVSNASFVLEGVNQFEGFTIFWLNENGGTIYTQKNQNYIGDFDLSNCSIPNPDFTQFNEVFTAQQPVAGFRVQNNTFGMPCTGGGDGYGLDDIKFDPYDPTKQEKRCQGGPSPGNGRGNPCDTATGNKYQREVDFESVSGVPSVVRHYSSISTEDEGLGIGWKTAHLKSLQIDAAGSDIRAHRGNGNSQGFLDISGSWVGGDDSDITLLEDATGFTVTLPNGDFERYGLNGKIESENRRGQVTTYTYDASGLLQEVIRPFGHTLTFAFDPNGHVQSITDPSGENIQYGYDVNDNLTTVTYPDLKSRLYHYEDPNFPNALTGITDENNVRFATFAYDAIGKAVVSEHTETTNGGPQEKFTFSYDEVAVTTTVVNPNGTSEVLTFDQNLGIRNRISTVNQADGKANSQTFDNRNNLLTETDEEGRVTKHTYNSSNQRISTTEAFGTPDARVTTISYVSPSLDLIDLIRTPSVVSGSFHDVATTYDANLNVDIVNESGFEPDGTAISRSTDFDFDSFGRLIRIDGPRTDVSDVTLFSYYDCTTGNECGQLSGVVNAEGHGISYDTYDANGRLTKMTDANGLVTENSYDVRGHLSTFSETPSGAFIRTTTYAYTSTGHLQTITSPEGLTLTHVYDAAQNLREISDSLNNSIEFTYDVSGNRTEQGLYDPDGILSRAIQTSFDIRDRVSSSTELGNVTQYDFNSVGNPSSIVDANSNGTNYQSDMLDRVSQIVDSLTGVTRYDYDVRDNVVGVTTPNGIVTQYSYDDFGNHLREISADRGTLNYAYDAASNLVSQTDANGIVAVFDYDALNRQIAISYPSDSAADVSLTYDQNNPGQHGIGRLTQVVEQTGAVTFHYDGLGNLISDTRVINGSTFETLYAYDGDNNLIQMTYPSGRIVDYGRSSIGRIETITTREDAAAPNEALVTSVSYRPFGPLSGLQFGNGQSMSIVHDQAYQIKEIDTQSATSTVQDLTYGVDLLGNITNISDNLDNALSQSFTYDPINRLDTAQGGYGARDFDYDANDNRTSLIHDGQSTSYTYAANSNRLSDTVEATDAWSYTYDNSGNLISKLASDGAGWLYGYNTRNRLETVTQRILVPRTKGNGPPREEDTVVGAYVYNALGQRVSKTTATETTTYIYGIDGQLLAEIDNQGNVFAEYMYLNSLPIAVHSVTTTPPPPPPPPEDIIVDNDESGTTPVGTWDTLTSNKDFGADHLRADGGSGSTFTWVPALSAGGDYEVFAWWATKNNYSDNVPYVITHNGQQSTLTADHSSNGQQWNLLGTFTFAGDGTDSVQVSDANGKTIADAVRFTSVVTIPPPQTTEATYFIHTDHLGTPQRLTNASGNVVWAIELMPFGAGNVNEDVDGNGLNVTMNFRLPGQTYDDESGLHYNYFRTYDPSTGRYLESDPIGLNGGINTYVYVGLSPTNYIDPFGLIRCESTMIGSPKIHSFPREKRREISGFNFYSHEYAGLAVRSNLDPRRPRQSPIGLGLVYEVWLIRIYTNLVEVFEIEKITKTFNRKCYDFETGCDGEKEEVLLTDDDFEKTEKTENFVRDYLERRTRHLRLLFTYTL